MNEIVIHRISVNKCMCPRETISVLYHLKTAFFCMCDECTAVLVPVENSNSRGTKYLNLCLCHGMYAFIGACLKERDTHFICLCTETAKVKRQTGSTIFFALQPDYVRWDKNMQPKCTCSANATCWSKHTLEAALGQIFIFGWCHVHKFLLATIRILHICNEIFARWMQCCTASLAKEM